MSCSERTHWIAPPSHSQRPHRSSFPAAVGNLAYDLSEQDVIDYFGKVGPVKAVR